MFQYLSIFYYFLGPAACYQDSHNNGRLKAPPSSLVDEEKGYLPLLISQ
jgi:hypothetical protein